MVVHPADNSSVADGCARYRDLLVDQSTFSSMTLEELLAADVLRRRRPRRSASGTSHGGCVAWHAAVPAGFEPMVAESKLEKSEHGLAPKGGGWYILNMRDAEWRHAEGRGAVCVVADDFEGWRRESDLLGVNPFVLMPGEPMAMYHWEADQEDFLVVAGEAVLIVEGEERQLRAWDFVHSPPHTTHVIVGAGSSPCLVIAVGARAHDGQPDSIGFPADEVARRHGASVEEDTMDGGEAYASVPPREPTTYRDGWLPE